MHALKIINYCNCIINGTFKRNKVFFYLTPKFIGGKINLTAILRYMSVLTKKVKNNISVLNKM